MIIVNRRASTSACALFSYDLGGWRVEGISQGILELFVWPFSDTAGDC